MRIRKRLFQHRSPLARSEWRKDSGKMGKFLHTLAYTPFTLTTLLYTRLTFFNPNFLEDLSIILIF